MGSCLGDTMQSQALLTARCHMADVQCLSVGTEGRPLDPWVVISQIYDAYLEDQERQAAAEEQSSRPRGGGRKGAAAGAPAASAADDAARRVRI